MEFPSAWRLADPANTFTDPKVGSFLVVSGRQDRDLVRLLIMNQRIEALRPIENLLPGHSTIEASYAVATFDGRLIYAVLVDGAKHSSGQVSESLRKLRQMCRLAGGRLQVWTRRRIERAYPAAVDRTLAYTRSASAHA